MIPLRHWIFNSGRFKLRKVRSIAINKKNPLKTSNPLPLSQGRSFISLLSSLTRDPGLALYTAAALLGAPIFLWRKWQRLHYHRYVFEFSRARWIIRFSEKQDSSTQAAEFQKPGPRIAFLTSSWGEVATVGPLTRALKEARPNARLIFTVTNSEAIQAVSQLTDEEVLPLPFDNIVPVARWHARARPDLVVVYEEFKLVALMRSLWVLRVPFVIVQARLNIKRANARYSPNIAFKRWQLRGLRDIIITAPDYLPSAKNLAPATAQAHIVGSIKFPRQRPKLTPEKEADLHQWIETNVGKAPLLVAGSTHSSEEAWVLDAFKIIRENWKQDLPPPILLLAPRRPRRGDEIVPLVEQSGLRVSRRSEWLPGTSNETVDVLILDTLGELMAVYQWATGIFVGGTIIGASQNVTEPLVWSKPVAYGPKRGNFTVEQTLCEDAGVGFRVESPEELAAHWQNLLQSPELRADLGRKADAVIMEQREAFNRTLQILIKAVDDVTL